MLDELWKGLGACAILAVAFVLTALVTIPLERRRLRRAEERFLRGRSPMSDAEFLRRVRAGPNVESFFLAARRVMAELCGIPPDMVHPDDTVRALMNLQWDNGFIEDLIFGLEDETKTRLSCKDRYPADAETFGAYVAELDSSLRPRHPRL